MQTPIENSYESKSWRSKQYATHIQIVYQLRITMQRIKIARETEFGVVCVLYQNSYAENGFWLC